MQKKICIISLIVSVIMVSCFPEDKTNDTGNIVEAEINGQNWSTTNASYNITDDGSEITMTGDGIAIGLKINELNEGSFDLSEEGNQVSLIIDGQLNILSEGIVEITSISNNTVSGSFEFEYQAQAEGENSHEVRHGHFYNLALLSNNLEEEQVLEKYKFMFLDGKNGKIEIEETNCIVRYTDKSLKLEVDEFQNKNLDLKIQTIDFFTTGIIFHISDDKVKSVHIDKMNNDQVSIIFKNKTQLNLF